MSLDPAEPSGGPPQPSPLEALLSGQGNLPAMLDIPPDADDETMVELAIALSLQEQVFVCFLHYYSLPTYTAHTKNIHTLPDMFPI